jgi:ABC-type thiamin/hydroxymethylpyrimidine transport system permease subunit
MLGVILMALVLVVVIPVTVMMSGAVVAGLLGWALKDNGEQTHEGSELIDLS